VGVIQIVERCTRLLKLNLFDCTNVSKKCLTQIRKNYPKILLKKGKTGVEVED
jgi:hypothetical protein